MRWTTDRNYAILVQAYVQKCIYADFGLEVYRKFHSRFGT